MNIGTCPQCGSPLELIKPELWAEQILVSGDAPAKQVLHAVERSLFGNCPMHGKVIYKKMGNHATQSEAKMKRLFPKSIRETARERLAADEKRRFTDALNGHCLPTQDEITGWLRHVADASRAATHIVGGPAPARGQALGADDRGRSPQANFPCRPRCCIMGGLTGSRRR